MKCPKCKHKKSKVLETGYNPEDDENVRERKCLNCNYVYFSQEVVSIKTYRLVSPHLFFPR